jgi:hypothetical protein
MMIIESSSYNYYVFITTSTFFSKFTLYKGMHAGRPPPKKMEDDLKKNGRQLKKKGRRPKKNGRRPKQKI